MGYPLSKALFNNAFGDANDLYFGAARDVTYPDALPPGVAAQIKSSPAFQKAVTDATTHAGDGAYSRAYHIELGGGGDVQYALHGVSAELEAEHIAGGVYRVWVTLRDRYDFEEYAGDELVREGVNFSRKQTELGAMRSFDVTIAFSYVTAHTHDWDGDRRVAHCAVCGEANPLRRRDVSAYRPLPRLT
jgi:hypothetical protein